MRILAAVVVVMLAAVACQISEPPSDDRTAVSGLYGLRTVNDTAPPYTLAAGTDDAIEILSDTLRLTVDGNYQDVSQYRRTTAGVVTLPVDTVNGSWVLEGATISFKDASGDLSTALVQGSTLPVSGAGFVSGSTLVSVYSK
jgi:hypothetical protein